MNQQAFDFAYPNYPASRPVDTSRAAAEAVAPTVPECHKQCLEILKRDAYTADEIAALLNRSVLYCRPRIAELAAKGLIEDTGDRRVNRISGRKAIVWRAKQ